MHIETLAVGVVLLMALIPLASYISGVLLRGIGISLVVAASAVTAWTTFRVPPSSLPEEAVETRPAQVAEDGYVTSQTCRACHPAPYASWHASYHRTMTQVASPESVVGTFDDVALTLNGLEYQLRRRGDQFVVDMPHPEWTGAPEQAPRIERTIVLTTGSHHRQVYWYSKGGTRLLGQFPFVYLIAEGKWVPRNAAFLRPTTNTPSSETGRWHTGCIKCHTTHGRSRISAPTNHDEALHPREIDTRVSEFGIACEACHGPADEHVRVNRDPRRRYRYHFGDEPDPTIINPARLSPRRASQVCGQCHGLTGVKTINDMLDWYDHGFPYRPGDELTDTRFVVNPRVDWDHDVDKFVNPNSSEFIDRHFWPDGMMRISGREYNGMIESPCFKTDDETRQLSCLSCHVMHKDAHDSRPFKVWADDQLGADMRTDRACLQCHEAFGENISEHTHHAAESHGSRCMNCHMSHTTYGILKAIRSHMIDSPTALASMETGRPNACNQCHLDKTLAWTADHLHTWYGVAKPDMTDDEKSIAASVLWTLRGDAGQRALMAWSMGWEPAREASEAWWMVPYLAELMADPYEAVRFIAFRSLRRYQAYRDLQYDFIALQAERDAEAVRVVQKWYRSRRGRPAPGRSALLLDATGRVQGAEASRLLDQRDRRIVILSE